MAQGAGNLPPFVSPLQEGVFQPLPVVAVALLPFTLIAGAAIVIGPLFLRNQEGEPDSGKKFFLSARLNAMLLWMALQTQETISLGALR